MCTGRLFCIQRDVQHMNQGNIWSLNGFLFKQTSQKPHFATTGKI